jgi:hypothetical protein
MSHAADYEFYLAKATETGVTRAFCVKYFNIEPDVNACETELRYCTDNLLPEEVQDLIRESQKRTRGNLGKPNWAQQTSVPTELGLEGSIAPWVYDSDEMLDYCHKYSKELDESGLEDGPFPDSRMERARQLCEEFDTLRWRKTFTFEYEPWDGSVDE